jgi:hypothetical protein
VLRGAVAALPASIEATTTMCSLSAGVGVEVARGGVARAIALRG